MRQHNSLSSFSSEKHSWGETGSEAAARLRPGLVLALQVDGHLRVRLGEHVRVAEVVAGDVQLHAGARAACSRNGGRVDGSHRSNSTLLDCLRRKATSTEPDIKVNPFPWKRSPSIKFNPGSMMYIPPRTGSLYSESNIP